ncbi:hypothetical protein FOL46_005342 [Perkinsus olseni]|uniref:Uncharacterized protein n=1 Tax=Perkinsus olseni TaxID=32597 RepID=A0A7J6LSS7_PEROL|nr:hypothetical protein FOL46_005342 [Perkinsus olseni]
MNPSTSVQTLVAAAMMRATAGAIPETGVFTTTVSGVCFLVGWPPADPGPMVNFFAGCGVDTASELKVIENPKNTFTLNLTDEQTATRYSSFIEAAGTFCQKVPKIEYGDMEKIIYEPGLKNDETLKIAIGSITRTFTPGGCPIEPLHV